LELWALQQLQALALEVDWLALSFFQTSWAVDPWEGTILVAEEISIFGANIWLITIYKYPN
jgi:hypothetical protein